MSLFDRWGEALDAWREILGAQRVRTDPDLLEARSRATYATSARVLGVLRPSSTEEVQACVRVANAYRVPLHVVSSGKNWGYGSAVPARDDSVLLDLGGLNEIRDYDERQGCVRVGAGVTYRQLHCFLQGRGGALWLDAVGSGGDCSVVGNILERGSGHSPYADHFAHCCAFEVVLPSGERIDTGFARFAGARAAPIHRWGIGPYLDGLFTQSNLGIVTRMTVWLMPAPERFEAYFFQIDSHDGLARAIDALQPLRVRGIIRNALHIGNAYRILPSLMQYPWNETGGAVPLQGEPFQRIVRARGLAAWNGTGALYGTRAEVCGSRRLLRRALAGKVRRLQFVDDGKLALAGVLARPLSWVMGVDVSAMLAAVRPVYDMLRGVPTEQYLATTYWRKRTPVPADMDPDRDGCGLIWCSPVIPIDGAQAREVALLVDEVLLAEGFEPGITMTLLTERALDVIISISWDREVPGEDERAARAYRLLLDALMERGYFPYRLGSNGPAHPGEPQPAYEDLLRTLKGALDPGGILMPGRYLPERL